MHVRNRPASPVDSAFVALCWPETGPVSTLTSRRIPHPPVEHPQLVPYAPIIRRTDHEIQVGVDPDAALVFRGERIGVLLSLLNGSQPISAVQRAARAAGLTNPQVRSALDALDAAGLLTERGAATYTAGLIPLRVRLIGAGPVGSQIARVLVASGLGTLYVYDNEPPDAALYPAAGVLTSRAEALRSALAEADSTISTLSHWSKPEAALDLTIVACDSPELDRVITDHLLRCVRCADLARTDADPQWPVVLTQLSRLHLGSPPALLAWAASVAAAQALAFLHGELPESAGTTLELSWPDFVMRLRRWPAHPRCGCGWLSHTE